MMPVSVRFTPAVGRYIAPAAGPTTRLLADVAVGPLYTRNPPLKVAGPRAQGRGPGLPRLDVRATGVVVDRVADHQGARARLDEAAAAGDLPRHGQSGGRILHTNSAAIAGGVGPENGRAAIRAVRR